MSRMLTTPTRIRALCFGLGLALLSPHGYAQGSEDVGKAKTYFNAGAQAFDAGQYLAAIQAFDQAYRFAPRPAILFSAAQAYRKQYFIDKNAAHLQQAIKNYRSYLTKVTEGGRRSDAAQALAELEPIAAKLMESPEGTEAPPVAAPVAQQTRLMVSSQTKGAQVELDGGKPQQTPLIAEVKPGKHKVRLSAPGYFPEDREIQAAEGGIVAVDVRLRPQPAKLRLKLEDGAEVRIDGRSIGVAPFNSTIDVEAGTRLVSITRTGRRPYSRELSLSKGEQRELTVELETTTQRKVSYAVLGTGVAGLLTGGAFTFLALRQESSAQDIDAARQSGNISGAQLAEYDDHVEKRDDYRMASIVAYGAGSLLTVTSLLLMTFDDPKPDLETRERGPAEPVDAPADAGPTLELSAAPIWGPGVFAAALGGRF